MQNLSGEIYAYLYKAGKSKNFKLKRNTTVRYNYRKQY